MKKQKGMSLQDAMMNAMAYHNAGDLQTAERMYRQILKVVPNEPDMLHCLGLLMFKTKQYAAAESLIEKALKINPVIAPYFNSLALVQTERGMQKMAIGTYRKALELKPDYAEAYNNMGIAYQELNKFTEAGSCYRTALGLNPNYVVAMNNLAGLLGNEGKYEESQELFFKAASLKPDYADPLINIGVSQLEKGELDKALDYFLKAYQADASSAKACCYMGAAWFRKMDAKEARIWYTKAAELAPYDANIFATLGQLGREYGGVTQQVEGYYRRALELNPNHFVALIGMADCAIEARRDDEVRKMLDHAWKVSNAPVIKVRQAAMLPSMLLNSEEIDGLRAGFEQGLKALVEDKMTMGNAYTEHLGPNFYLAYHGRNDRDLQQLAATFYRQASPMLTYTAPHCSGAPRKEGRLRIGFISRYLNMRHTISKLSMGLLINLSRDLFDVTLLSSATEDNNSQLIIEQSGAQFCKVPRNLPMARDVIAEKEFDILFYTDIGMDPFTFFLAYSRLAPVQCVTWGHPVTTGIDTVDAFISSDLIESKDADGHYTEQLVRMANLPSYYYRPEIAMENKQRSDFGLPASGSVYLCPQSLFKIHPDYDAILADILRRDTDGVIALLEGTVFYWNDLLKERFERTIPDVAKRILFLPRLSSTDFFSLINVSDVVLDPIHFGSGNSAYETFHVGKAIVTMPSEFMRGRVTLGCYRQMGIEDAIADSPEEYARIAVALAKDSALRESVESRIKEKCPVIFENMAAVRELENVLVGLHGRITEGKVNNV
jgi:predicted O-linked N-acetylglucosamine transferase (SPINDLY family)